ncbi:hypothetical protein Aple_100430 [Acrocarpospora pleiomorpha]|uniref:Uncharacterized protein n=1 Tax=Acrocarpospora pleiomorpha TaxID=90975 RepID=A0A5M3Y1G6_9ACTN|nr:hypothetical protein [Acrocarpospora pleiomorpha]GES27144.1 hypothetical protein Aple_100430 [Acrocarpospora pleiomorpha]
MIEEPDAGFATDRLLLGLRAAVTAICASVMASASLPRKLDVHQPLWPQVTAFGIMTVLLLVELVLLARRRPWGRWRIPALAVTLGASALATWSLAPHHVASTADWSFGTTGWVLLVLLSGQRLQAVLALLAAHATVTFMRVLVLGPSDLEFCLRLLAVSVGTIGFPVAAGVATAVLRDIAERAHAASLEAAEIRTAEELAAQVHETRRERFGEIHEAIEPILRALADGTLAISDPQVRRSCEFQAARMRRLFAETDLVADRLVHELRQGADVAERRGVMVQLEPVGSWPNPPLPVGRALAQAPMWLLSHASKAASISVIGAGGELAVHVTIDCPVRPEDVPEPDLPGVTQRVFTDTESTWIEVLWMINE